MCLVCCFFFLFFSGGVFRCSTTLVWDSLRTFSVQCKNGQWMCPSSQHKYTYTPKRPTAPHCPQKPQHAPSPHILHPSEPEEWTLHNLCVCNVLILYYVKTSLNTDRRKMLLHHQNGGRRLILNGFGTFLFMHRRHVTWCQTDLSPLLYCAMFVANRGHVEIKFCFLQNDLGILLELKKCTATGFQSSLLYSELIQMKWICTQLKCYTML